MCNFPRSLSRHCLNVLASIALVSVFTSLSAMVIPHPLYKNPVGWKASHTSKEFGPRSARSSSPRGMTTLAPSPERNLPTNVLVLRVQFSDVTFQSTEAYPDNLVHDKTYFERWMLHLTDFYANASHNQYILNYTMPDEVITLSQTMSHYGEDTSQQSDVLVEQMIADIITAADPTVDFNLYDGFIIFHAGAGQESDVGLSPNFTALRPNTLWSTFLSRDDFQYAFDPENDSYPGITTQDGKIIREVVLMPESEFHDYFPLPPDENSGAYFFSLYGVLCHQFGHQIGLPTLFDNVSSNGRSQGIGNWGLMGTGVWNSNGYVPAQLDAWCRAYLGWESVQTVQYDSQNLPVDYFLNQNPTAPRVYKIPISEKEYFLVENRQQNPDASLDPINGAPSFTFNLLDPGEQDYYPAPDTLRPFFNFMENRYKNCEWDFFLPGLGGPLRPGESMPPDGSGLLIWHIDENVIEENFSTDFDMNHVNGDATHKGVDVEEADGIQNLDTAVFDYYKYGGPFDTFRQDASVSEADNTYFGEDILDGLLHLPTAESYYGGAPLEIYDISANGHQMTFSVRYRWKLDTGYVGTNNLDACSVDFDQDGENEIFYPMPNGSMHVWKDEVPLPFVYSAQGNVASYAWDGSSVLTATVLTDAAVPTVVAEKISLNSVSSYEIQNAVWAAPIVSFDHYMVLPIYSINQSRIEVLDSPNLDDGFIGNELVSTFTFADSICTNLVYFKQTMFGLLKSSDNLKLTSFNPLEENSAAEFNLAIPVDSIIVAMIGANITPDGGGDLLIQTPYAIYLTELNGQIRPGFPKMLQMYCGSPASISDVDRNGSLDMLFGGENTFAVLDYNGGNMLTTFSGLSQTDTLYVSAGVLAGDLDGDNRTEYLGAFSRNRLAAWEDNQRLMPGYPVSFAERSRNLPFIHTASDAITYIWLPTDNGKIYRIPLVQNEAVSVDSLWYCKYGNLQRTASREDSSLPNDYFTSAFYVPDETYIFPNPLKSIYAEKLTFNIMTSRDAKVEVSIYNISGSKLFHKNVMCKAWLRNREAVDFPVDHLSSGVYIATLKSGSHIKRMKFAVEK